nr:gamma-glutamyltransferase [Catenovulum sediminis]
MIDFYKFKASIKHLCLITKFFSCTAQWTGRIAILMVSLFTLSCGQQSLNQVKIDGKREARDPEAATGLNQKKLVFAEHGMISAANPYAVEAGMQILKAGGTAMDAAVAVQAVLTLVEPQSSGIGGGAFIMYWQQSEKKLYAFEGRETAPEHASETLFFEEGKAISWFDGVVGGRSVGAPGVLAALNAGQQKFGQLAWSGLFKRAIELSETGFEVSPRLAKLLAMRINPGIEKLPQSRAYFFPGDQPLQAGELKTNLQLAESLRGIANQGIDYFYRGELADKIVAAAQNSPIAPGLLNHNDLKNYQVKWREPLCGVYQKHQICGFGPPSSGAFSVLMTLKLLEKFHLAQYSANQKEALHLFTQASKLAFADRNQYLADNDYVDVPLNLLLSAEYINQRAAIIQPDRDFGKAQAGLLANGGTSSLERPSTSHISIVDKWGNALSMTTSIEMAFGSAVMAGGFLLNNQLTDFSFNPEKSGDKVANRVQPGKRPRSSMSPTVVFDPKDNLLGVIGSPGGSRIINYVSHSLIALIDWKLDIQSAIDLPKITNMNGKTSLEAGTDVADFKAYFEQLGHQAEVRTLNSGLHGIWKTEGKWSGAADPRREGIAAGY